jgi:hypothetical protein
MRALLSCIGVVALAAVPAAADDFFFTATLDGLQEVGGGDPDGTGFATLHVNNDDPANPFIDWTIEALNIDMPLIGAHIHQADAGVNGPVVIDFSSQLEGAGLVDMDLLNLIANPSGFYVNLHNDAFQGGAIRGQIPAPGAAAVLALGGMIALRRRR